MKKALTALSLLSTTGLNGMGKGTKKVTKIEINQNTGVVPLSSIFPNISKKIHRNGRTMNIDNRFPLIPLKYK